MIQTDRRSKEMLQNSLQRVLSLLQAQNLPELGQDVETFDSVDIAAILEALPQAARLVVVNLIPIQRLGYVLLDITDRSVRNSLLAEMDQTTLSEAACAMNWGALVRLLCKLPAEQLNPLLEGLEKEKQAELRAALSVQKTPIDSIKAFVLKNGRLVQIAYPSADDLLDPEVVWLDMINPTEEERELVERSLRVDLPEDQEMEDIEESARCYIDDSGVHISSFFIHKEGNETANVTVSFTLGPTRLVTIRQEELAVFRLFRLRARVRPGFVNNAQDILLAIFDAAVEYDADMLEMLYTELEPISQHVLNRTEDMTDKLMAETVSKLAAYEDVNGKVRLDLMDTRRALSFLVRSRLYGPEQESHLREILRDLESLNHHSSFLFDKINFLMDAIMGLINLAQNKIIKIFSIASVVFLPPTLVASIYGMNFKILPELQWEYGYVWAIGLIVISAFAPYLIFKRKGWL